MAIANFHDVSFPLDITPSRFRILTKTSIVKTRDASEQRGLDWLDFLWEAELGTALPSQTQVTTLLNFWRAREGARYSWRWKNPLDNTVVDAQIGVGDDNEAQFQLQQAYPTGISGDTHIARKIVALPTGSVTVEVAATARTHFDVDTATGVLTFGKLQHTVTLERVTAVDRIVSDTSFNWVTYGVQVGDNVKIAGSTALDGVYTVASFADSNTTIEVTGANFTSGESGITADVLFPPDSSDAVTWSGTFDTPARFQVRQTGIAIQSVDEFINVVGILEERAPWGVKPYESSTIPTTLPIRFPNVITDTSQYGPEHHLLLMTADAGILDPINVSAETGFKGSFQFDPMTVANALSSINFFISRHGRYTSFNLEDRTDLSVTDENIGTGDGAVVAFQLTKKYTSGATTLTRTIRRPVASTVTFDLAATPTTQYTLNATTGIVTFTLGTITITFDSAGKTLTRSAGSWVTDGVVDSDKLKVVGSASNDQIFTVTGAPTATVATVTEAVTNEGPVAVEVQRPPLTGVAVTWSGSFDVLVRSDSDTLDIGYTDAGVVRIGGLPLVGVTEQTIGSGYLAGQSGRVVVAPQSCAAIPLDPGPLNKKVVRLDPGHIEFSAATATPAEELLHYKTAGFTGFTTAIAFQNWTPPGVPFIVHGPTGAFPPGGTSWPNGDEVPGLFEMEMIKSGIGSRLGLRVRAQCGAVATKIDGGCVFDNIQSSDNLVEYYGPGLPTHGGGAIADLVVLIVTISIPYGRMWVSGSMYGSARMTEGSNGTYQGWRCAQGVAASFPVFAYQGQRGSNFAFQLYPAIGAKASTLGGTLRPLHMDLVELMCCMHTGITSPFLFGAERALSDFHRRLVVYFSQRYRLGQSPMFHPGELLVGWWTTHELRNHAAGTDPFGAPGPGHWPAVGGIIDRIDDGLIAVSVEDAATVPALPAGNNLRVFDGSEVVALV